VGVCGADGLSDAKDPHRSGSNEPARVGEVGFGPRRGERKRKWAAMMNLGRICFSLFFSFFLFLFSSLFQVYNIQFKFPILKFRFPISNMIQFMNIKATIFDISIFPPSLI
jgi:hypothetical protein